MSFFVRAGKFWFALTLMAVALYIAYFNKTFIPVSLPPFIAPINLPAFVVYIFWLFVGAAMTWGFLGVDLIKKSWRIRKLNKQLALSGLNEVDQPARSDKGKSGTKSGKNSPYQSRDDISIY